MAYADPGTFTSGTVGTAAEMNVIADDVRYLKAASDLAALAGVSLARTSSQSIPNSSSTAISWSAANLDVGGWWTSGATFTVPVGTVPAGYTSAVVEIQASARFDVNSAGARTIEVTQNGTVVEQSFTTSGLPSDTTPVAVTVWAEVVDGDALQVLVVQSSGGALNCSHASVHARRVGAV